MNVLIMNCSPVRNGATAEITNLVSAYLKEKYEVRAICIDDYIFNFCKGCRVCHNTAKCMQSDDVDKIIEQYEWADIIVSVAPSYWADIPGQFKAFIDRCTPWCNTHEPHATIGNGKKGYIIALRTGSGMKECLRIIESIEHFYGHMEIECYGSLSLCSIEDKDAVEARKAEILDFAGMLNREKNWRNEYERTYMGGDAMKKLSEEAEKIMKERFGKDSVIALATVENEVPYVRYVNAYYENGAFYIITHALSNKMKHMENNSAIAIAGEWFTAHGNGINLGYFGKEDNYEIAEKLKKIFAEWIDNGHNNFDDENTIILCVELTSGLLLSHGTRYEF